MPCDTTGAITGVSTTVTGTNLFTNGAKTCVSENVLFFYSNRPEALTQGTMADGVLWHDRRDGIYSASYKLWLWHHNCYPNWVAGQACNPTTDLRICVTLQNLGTVPIQVSGGGQLGVRADANQALDVIGKCLAQGQLADTLDEYTPDTVTINAGTTAIIRQAPLLHSGTGQAIGLYLEFSVDVTGIDPSSSWILRVVYDLDGQPDSTYTGKVNLIDANAVASGDGRGTWLATGVSGRNHVTLTSGDPWPIGSADAYMVLGDTTDECWLATDSYDPTDAKDDKGRYGVLYAPSDPTDMAGIKVNYFYDPNHFGPVNLYLIPRGGPWAGAIQRVGDARPFVTETIGPGLTHNAIRVYSYNVARPPTPGTGVLMFRLAHAGGSALPVRVVISSS